MTLVENNPHDYKPHLFESKETFIDKELDDSLAQFKSAEGNITKLMEQIFRICILINSQSRLSGRVNLEKILPEILEKAETQSASYRGHHVHFVYLTAALGGILSIGSGVYGWGFGVESTNAICAGLSASGQASSQLSNLYNESLNGPRGLTTHEIQHLTFLRDRFSQAAQSSDAKLSEAQRALQQAIASQHQIAAQIFSAQG